MEQTGAWPGHHPLPNFHAPAVQDFSNTSESASVDRGLVSCWAYIARDELMPLHDVGLRQLDSPLGVIVEVLVGSNSAALQRRIKPMSLEISAQERPVIHYVGIPITAHLSEFGAPEGPNAMIPHVYQWLADREVVPQGGPLYIYRYVGMPDEPLDLTVAVPVAEPVKPTSGFVLGSLPAGTYIVGRHLGAPDQIPDSHAKVQQWAEQNEYRLDVLRNDDGTLWTGHAEHFLTDPTEEPDASKWITELLFKTV